MKCELRNGESSEQRYQTVAGALGLGTWFSSYQLQGSLFFMHKAILMVHTSQHCGEYVKYPRELLNTVPTI